MERRMQHFTFFVVTKGNNTGVYASFDEANRMAMIRAEREAIADVMAETGIVESPRRPPRTLPTADGRVTPVVGGNRAPIVPSDKSASHDFALNNSMELWLTMYCYDTAIPAPCFFREEKFHRDHEPLYAFSVIIPGNPYGVDVSAKGRYSFIEDDAREDAAFMMLSILLQKKGKEVRDFNYLRVRVLQREVADLQKEVRNLEDNVRRLKSEYESSMYCVTP
ncbi:hypothetical protein AHAS_Ahas19G0073800 [Arachis hypogaea]